jgi:hypothetical protein
MGPRHQPYAALSGLTSKGEKSIDKETAGVSYATVAEYKQGIFFNNPKPKSLNTTRIQLVTQKARHHLLLLSRVDARTSSPRTSMITTGSTR